MAYENFYDDQYQGGYCDITNMKEHSYYQYLSLWLDQNKGFRDKKFLEIGSGRGALQDIVDNYTGLDYSETVAANYHKRFVNASAEHMPFADNEFDVIWSYAVWEHIPNPELSLNETVRVLRGGGNFCSILLGIVGRGLRKDIR